MKNILLILISVFGTQAVLAADLGPAGCGLGHQLFKKDNQVLAATTNGTSWNQTFGMTSGTSNCDADQKMAQMVMFVEGNRIALSNEAARGQGETVEALSALLGCTDAGALGSELKANYGEIFTNNTENAMAISNSIRHAVETSNRLTCAIHG